MITLEEVKTYLGITDTEQDAAIALWIPVVEGKVQDLLNREFDGDFPLQYKPNLAKLVAFEIARAGKSAEAGGLLSSRSLGSFSVSYKDNVLDSQTGYPVSVVGEMVRALKVARVHNGGEFL